VRLDAAESLQDLNVPPGNRLEKLSGDREGQHSIRINDQWRICQARFDLEVEKDRLGDRLEKEVLVLSRAG
jgi:plasmid maintenance system killer protein